MPILLCLPTERMWSKREVGSTKNVTLTATIKYKDLSTTRKFEITVLADEYVGYENIAAVKAKEDKTKDVSKVKFSGTVSFTTNSGFGVSDGSASIYCYQSGQAWCSGKACIF